LDVPDKWAHFRRLRVVGDAGLPNWGILGTRYEGDAAGCIDGLPLRGIGRVAPKFGPWSVSGFGRLGCGYRWGYACGVALCQGGFYRKFLEVRLFHRRKSAKDIRENAGFESDQENEGVEGGSRPP
jgi:hypothetical protein